MITFHNEVNEILDFDPDDPDFCEGDNGDPRP